MYPYNRWTNPSACSSFVPVPLLDGCPSAHPCSPNPTSSVPCTTARCSTIGTDYGPNPYVVNINTATLGNPYFRHAIWTGTHLQLTVMCIPPGGEIGLEAHPTHDQFLRLEQGMGYAVMGPTQTDLTFRQNVSEDSAIFIPAGTWHNVVNAGSMPMKLYSVYAPTQHPAGTIHCTKADSDAAE